MRLKRLPRRPSPAKGVDRSHKGEPAPVVKFKNPDGGDFDLAKFKGGPVLVNLWASWCAPCIKELPTLQELEQSHNVDGKLGCHRGQPGHGAAGIGRSLPRRTRHRPLRRLPRCRDEADRRARRPGHADHDPLRRRRARKCGAMSATSTGPARKRRSSSPKPARRRPCGGRQRTGARRSPPAPAR